MDEVEDSEPRLSGPAVGALAIAVLVTIAILYNTLWAQGGRGEGFSANEATGSTRLEVDADEEAPPATVTLHFDETVEAVQRELAAAGLFAGPVDGIAGRRTREAIATYQRGNGMTVTGVASDNLLDQLKLAREFAQAAAMGDTTEAMTVASTGAAPDERIRRVQVALSELGYAPGAITGELSDETRRAIRDFERDRGIAETGDISDLLISELSRYGGITPLN